MSGSFDFGTAFEPERPRAAIPQPPPQPPAPRSAPPARERQHPRAVESSRRGQKLSWAALVVAIVSAAFIGFGIYLALDAIEISLDDPLSDAQGWMSLVVLGLCCGLLALAGGVVSAIRARPRTIATMAIVAATVLPVIAAVVGIKFGIDAVVEDILDKAQRVSDETAVVLAKAVSENSLDLPALVQLILHLIRS